MVSKESDVEDPQCGSFLDPFVRLATCYHLSLGATELLPKLSTARDATWITCLE